MDLGRYVLQQDRVYTSALKGCPAGHEADFWVGSTDSGRMFERELSREAAYSWNASHQQIHDRDTHANSYCGTDSYRNHGFDRPARFSGRSPADISPYDDGYDYRHHISRRRDGRYERDTHYGQSIYGSDCDKSSKRDSSWKRYDSRVRVRDKQILSWERDPSPEHSLSRGHDDRQRSRSPRVPSRWKENYDDRRNHEHSSMVPSATVKVMGLSSNTTEEDLYQIIAGWRPICNVRVVKEKESGSCRGFAFINFPSVVAARTMIEEVGYDGLVVDGRELSFEYGIKKIKSKKQIMHDKLSSKRRRHRTIARAAVAAPAQKQQQEEEKEAVEEEGGEVDDTEVVEVEDIRVEEEGEVEDGGAGEAEVEKLLQGEVEELQQHQQQVVEGELEIGEMLHGPSSHNISASISCEELEEKMDCIKKDPYLKAIVEDIEIGGPEVMMRYLSNPEVLQKLGHALGFGVSESIVNAPDDDEDKTGRG